MNEKPNQCSFLRDERSLQTKQRQSLIESKIMKCVFFNDKHHLNLQNNAVVVINHWAPSSQSNAKMIRLDKQTTEIIDVGTPTYAPEEWMKFEFRFHRFESLSYSTESRKVNCFGADWCLELLPYVRKNKRYTGRTPKYWVSLKLTRSSLGCYPVSCNLRVKDWDGDYRDEIPLVMQTDEVIWKCFSRRSRIIDEQNDILVDGALVVEVNLKLETKSNLPPKPFIPDNHCDEKMELLYNDESFADVEFVFPNEISNEKNKKDEDRIEDSDKGSGDGALLNDNVQPKCLAHSLVLKASVNVYFSLVILYLHHILFNL